ncbi:MAG: PQQ-binding-like beta-propeller repeat protein [Pirellulaceae bacterium]|nr:PQQ-binding-like beta-propeller repeat protein [Pirellulaceae bacterium]
MKAPITSLLLAILASTASAADWPQFLGPARNGISPETGLMKAWPKDGPKEVWRVKGGVGMSGIAVSGGKAMTLVQRDSKQWLLALDAKTGKTLWETPLAPEYENQMGKGPRGTPAVSGDQVFASTGEGILIALSVKDGKILWQHNPIKELGGTPADYGMACSPLVVGSQVIVTPGAAGAAVVAYDAKSGKIAWKTGDDPAGYSSPALLKVGGKEQIVVFTGASAIGVQPGSGELLWRYAYETEFDCNIATPLAVDGRVFISCGENHGCVLLDVAGKEPAIIWESQGTKSVFKNEWQTAIQLGGHLYGFDNVGSAGPVTHLACINAATGVPVWQKSRFGKGNLIAADGKLFLSTMQGELVVLSATPKGYEELRRKTILGTTRQAPALSSGLLYLRDDKEIVCLDVR